MREILSNIPYLGFILFLILWAFTGFVWFMYKHYHKFSFLFRPIGSPKGNNSNCNELNEMMRLERMRNDLRLNDELTRKANDFNMQANERVMQENDKQLKESDKQLNDTINNLNDFTNSFNDSFNNSFNNSFNDSMNNDLNNFQNPMF